MKGYRIQITDKAISDIVEIQRYISEEFLDYLASARLIDKFEEAIASLKTFPERHEIVKDEWAEMRFIRKYLVDNYIIFYTIDNNDSIVYVIRVLNMRRDWKNLI